MKMNIRKEDNLSYIVAAHLTGPEYKVTFSEEMTDAKGFLIDLWGYNQICIIGPLPFDLSPFWRVWTALYDPDHAKQMQDEHRLPMAHPWQDYFRRALAREVL